MIRYILWRIAVMVPTLALISVLVFTIIELPPAGTLIGLAKRALKGVELLAVKTPDDLDAARTLIKEHSA